MRSILLPTFLFSLAASAQDWALLNPAYKYNYTTDETDTIHGQLFVADIDTLGPNDHVFSLNRIAEICDTCSTDPYPLFVRPEAPQWAGGTAHVVNGAWHFTGNGSRLILPQAPEGATWLYDTMNGVWAEMGPTLASTTFGLPDEHRTITLSNGDSMVISREHGVLRWPSGHHLIGINGPQLGRTIPTLAQFFPFAADDVLEYEKWYGYCNGTGGCEGRSSEFKFTVESGVQQDTATAWQGWMAAHDLWYFQPGGAGSPTQYVHSHSSGSSNWISGMPELPWAELLFSHPGQLVFRRHFMDPQNAGPNACIAAHRLDPAGRYVIGCRSFAQGTPDEVGHFFFYQGETPGPDGTIPLSGPEDWILSEDPQAGVIYTEGIGLFAFTGNYFERGEHYLLRGLLLDGDTVFGSLTDDSILLGLENAAATTGFSIAPNPASGHISIEGLHNGPTQLELFDASGRKQNTIDLKVAERTIVDVSALTPGIYLLRSTDGSRTARFVVTH